MNNKEILRSAKSSTGISKGRKSVVKKICTWNDLAKELLTKNIKSHRSKPDPLDMTEEMLRIIMSGNIFSMSEHAPLYPATFEKDPE